MLCRKANANSAAMNAQEQNAVHAGKKASAHLAGFMKSSFAPPQQCMLAYIANAFMQYIQQSCMQGLCLAGCVHQVYNKLLSTDKTKLIAPSFLQHVTFRSVQRLHFDER